MSSVNCACQAVRAVIDQSAGMIEAEVAEMARRLPGWEQMKHEFAWDIIPELFQRFTSCRQKDSQRQG